MRSTTLLAGRCRPVRTQIAFVVSQTSTGGDQAPAVTGICAAAASCKTENSRPIRSVNRFISIRSRPAAPTLLTIKVSSFETESTALAFSLPTTGPRTHQSFQLIHERLKLGIVSDPIKARVTRKERIIGHAFADRSLAATSRPPRCFPRARKLRRYRASDGDRFTSRCCRTANPPSSHATINTR